MFCLCGENNIYSFSQFELTFMNVLERFIIIYLNSDCDLFKEVLF